MILQFLTRAGVEIGVASTKAFTTQLVALYLLATTLAKLREFLDEGDKAKVTLRFRGREMAHQELGLKLLVNDGGEA